MFAGFLRFMNLLERLFKEKSIQAGAVHDSTTYCRRS